MTIASTAPFSYASTTTWNGASFDQTESYTVPAGADVLTLRLAGSRFTPASVIYGGVALTLRHDEDDGNSGACYIYDLLSPGSGTDDLVINSGASAGTFRGLLNTASDVDLVTPRGVTVGDAGFKATLSSALTTTDTAIVLDIINISSSFSATEGAGQTAETTAETSGSGIIAYSSKETATTTSTTMSWSVTGSDWVAQAAISYNQAAAGPTLTGPDTTTVDATRTVTGTALDTVTTAGLKIDDDSYSKSLTITPIDTVSFSQVDAIDAGIALGTPVDSLPVEADVLAATATAYQIQQWVDDGVNPEVSRNITLNYLAAHSTVQTMLVDANTDPAESFFGTTYIVVEDDMQFSHPDVVDGVTLTVNDKGEPTTSADQTISFTGRFWSPSTGQASYAGFTVLGSAIIGGGLARNLIRNIVRPLIH